MQNYTATFFFSDIFFHRFRRLVTYDFIPWENTPAYINSVHNNNCQRTMAVVSISACEGVLLLDLNAMRVPQLCSLIVDGHDSHSCRETFKV